MAARNAAISGVFSSNNILELVFSSFVRVIFVSEPDAAASRLHIFVSAPIAALIDLARRADSGSIIDLKEISIRALQFVGSDIIGPRCNFVAAFSAVPNT